MDRIKNTSLVCLDRPLWGLVNCQVPMREFRLSKYNPESRNEHGEYLANEWTEYSDVGQLVSIEDYVTT